MITESAYQSVTGRCSDHLQVHTPVKVVLQPLAKIEKRCALRHVHHGYAEKALCSLLPKSESLLTRPTITSSLWQLSPACNPAFVGTLRQYDPH